MAAPVGQQAHVQVAIPETAEQAEQRRLATKNCVFGAKFIGYTAAAATAGSIAGAILAPVTVITAASGAGIGAAIAWGAGTALAMKGLLTDFRPVCHPPFAEIAQRSVAPLDPEYPPGEACVDVCAAYTGTGIALYAISVCTSLPMGAVIATAGLGAGIACLARDLKGRCTQWRRGTPILTPPAVQLNPAHNAPQGGMMVQVRVVQPQGPAAV